MTELTIVPRDDETPPDPNPPLAPFAIMLELKIYFKFMELKLS